MSIRYRQVLFSYFSWFIIINGKRLEFWNHIHLNIEIAAIFGVTDVSRNSATFTLLVYRRI